MSEKIYDIAKKLNISDERIIPYGLNKVKIDTSNLEFGKYRKGKIILCTAITPTKAGEGKTTTAISLADSLAYIGKDTIACLREPSLGPVFGVKGGGAGGGESTLFPEDDINLHFTGDIHAITSVNNLIVAMIDNELYQKSNLDVDPDRIVLPRNMDMNDRALRDIIVANNDPKVAPHHSSFCITAASEVMAVFCLSKDEEDFLNRVDNITVAYSNNGRPIYVKDLECRNAVRYLIHDALMPNLVQTKYGTPALVHGGPFANIAHGVNSLISTDLALKLSDYVVTEAGFGSDLGMEKYLDVVSPIANFAPSLICMVVTIRALKLHGGVQFSDLNRANVHALKEGAKNLLKHLKNVSLYNIPVIVSINKFNSDTDNEIHTLENILDEEGYEYALNTSYVDGPKGGEALAWLAIENIEKKNNKKFAPIIKQSMSIEKKIHTIATNIYGAKDVEYSNLALKQLKELSKSEYSDFSVVISKTPNSLSDDPKLLNVPTNHTLHVKSFRVFTGAKFIVPLTGEIFTMPGLPKRPAAKNMESTHQ